jgi:hypothetical protein
MTRPNDQPATPNQRFRWFHLTPGKLLVILLVVEAILLLSERFRWFPFNEHKGWTVLIAVAAASVFLLFMLIWFIFALLFRRRFQFSIRSLLVLTVAVAIPCSWLAVEMKWAREQREAVEAIRKAEGCVFYDYECDASFVITPNTAPPGSVWLRTLVGDDYFSNAIFVTLSGTDAELSQLEHLSQLQAIKLWTIEDADAGGFEHLKGLTTLHTLDFIGTHITDAGLKHIAGLTQIQMLGLQGTNITDTGLKHLRCLSQLQMLALGQTQITDDGLEHLKGLKQLTTLYLVQTEVTDAGVAKLQKALPNCKIFH